MAEFNLKLAVKLRALELQIADLKAEIERLSLLLALTLGRSHTSRRRFIEIAKLLRKKEDHHGHRAPRANPQHKNH